MGTLRVLYCWWWQQQPLVLYCWRQQQHQQKEAQWARAAYASATAVVAGFGYRGHGLGGPWRRAAMPQSGPRDALGHGA